MQAMPSQPSCRHSTRRTASGERTLAFAGLGEELLAVGEPVRFQEKAEDQGAIRCPRLVLVAGRAPYELTGSAHPFVILQRALQNVGLFQCRVFVQRHDGTGLELEERRGQALLVRVQHLDLNAWKFGIFPWHVRYVQKT